MGNIYSLENEKYEFDFTKIRKFLFECNQNFSKEIQERNSIIVFGVNKIRKRFMYEFANN